MTQFKVGITQQLPRGDELAIQSEQLALSAAAEPFVQANQQARLALWVTSLYLDLYKMQQTLALLEKDTRLFKEMVEIATASYSSRVGQTRQHDVISAELELIALKDKLAAAKQALDEQKAQLLVAMYGEDLSLAPELHDLSFKVVAPRFTADFQTFSRLITAAQDKVINTLQAHPSVKAIEQHILAAEKDIALADEAYKPQFAMNAAFAHRGDAPSTMSRSEFLSVGMTFDLPLFTANRQDQNKAAAVYQTEAIKTERLILLKRLLSEFKKVKTTLTSLKARERLYRTQILPKSKERSDVALSAYTHDDGAFSDAIIARTAELNARINALAINTELQKAQANMQYLLAPTTLQGASHE